MTDAYLRASDAARRLGLSVRRVHQLAARGGLPTARVAGLRVFPSAAIAAEAARRGRGVLRPHAERTR